MLKSNASESVASSDEGPLTIKDKREKLLKEKEVSEPKSEKYCTLVCKQNYEIRSEYPLKIHLIERLDSLVSIKIF